MFWAPGAGSQCRRVYNGRLGRQVGRGPAPLGQEGGSERHTGQAQELGREAGRRRAARRSPTFCLAKPGSMTYTMPSMVSDVSAMLVDTMILRPAGPPGRAAGGAGSKMRCCCCGGNVE